MDDVNVVEEANGVEKVISVVPRPGNEEYLAVVENS